MAHFLKLSCENKAKGVFLLLGCTHLYSQEVGATTVPFGVTSAGAWRKAEMYTQLDNLPNRCTNHYPALCVTVLIGHALV